VATEKLSRSDRFAVDAATGWIMLGNADEAWAELEKISEGGRRVPEALELEWSIQAARKEWQAALSVAQVLIEVAPEKSFGWVHKAYALRRVQAGKLEAAEAVLLIAVRRFPTEPIIPFNLACYAAQLGKLPEAKEWLHKAMEAAGNVEEIVRMAKADEDLTPLADYLETL
jgi:tetratricopeptide (TPR) repeat protein